MLKTMVKSWFRNCLPPHKVTHAEELTSLFHAAIHSTDIDTVVKIHVSIAKQWFEMLVSVCFFLKSMFNSSTKEL